MIVSGDKDLEGYYWCIIIKIKKGWKLLIKLLAKVKKESKGDCS